MPISTIEGYASQFAGQPIAINCVPDAQMLAGADGYAQPLSSGAIPGVVFLKVSECVEIEHAYHPRVRHPQFAFFTFGHQRADLDLGSALSVLEHETMHVVLQSSDESAVECATYTNRWALLKLFRFPSWVATMELAGMAWHHVHMAPNYLQDC